MVDLVVGCAACAPPMVTLKARVCGEVPEGAVTFALFARDGRVVSNEATLLTLGSGESELASELNSLVCPVDNLPHLMMEGALGAAASNLSHILYLVQALQKRDTDGAHGGGGGGDDAGSSRLVRRTACVHFSASRGATSIH